MSDLIAVGIDLGTTYSSLAWVNNTGQVEIIPNAESERLTPSAVFFDDENIVVGQIAKNAATTHPDKVVMFIKRLMGRSDWYYTHEGQRFTPSDISAMILTKLKRDAEVYLQHRIHYAVITVPAYFDDARRRATIAAGEIAGLNILGLINEPTAAAISFGVDRGHEKETVLVYDLGGGTFDVTVMRVEGQEFRVLATDGDHQLGGKDFDDALIRHAIEQFSREYGFDPTQNDRFVEADLREQAEKAKRELSKRSKTVLMLRGQGKTSRIEVTRKQFESLIKPKIDTTLVLVGNMLQNAHLQPAQIDRVLLVGGSTRIPLVRNTLTQFFGKEPDVSINPDEAIALGAALVAAKKIIEVAPATVPPPIEEKIGQLAITDVTSHSLGIESVVPGTNQLFNSILIPRNSPLPIERSREFTTATPGSTSIRIIIYQGEFEDPKYCNPIGDFILSGLPPNRPAGCKVRVTISCGTDGVVSVTATDIESGRQAQTEVRYTVGQPPAQISAKKRWLDSKLVT